MLQHDDDIGSRQIGRCSIRPLDHANTLPAEVFVQSRIQIFLRLAEPIKIKVIQV